MHAVYGEGQNMNKQVRFVISLTILLGLLYATTALSWNDDVTHKDISRSRTDRGRCDRDGVLYSSLC